MVDQTRHYLRVFLASPGDVADERGIALEVLDRVQYDPLLRGRIVLQPVAWDQPGAGVPMLATMTPQTAIAAGLPKPAECDIVVVVFWSRMGTPLPDEYQKPDGTRYLSGTEWEYLDAVGAAERSSKPDVLVYRRSEERLLSHKDPQFEDKLRQQRQVDALFASLRNADGSVKRGCNEYATPEDFRKKLEEHLKSIIRRLLDKGDARQAGATGLAPLPPWQGSPFPGLRACTPDDAPIFFGRGRETDELIARLADASCRALVVVGASGSGKSSLVAAGLLPRLRANAIEGSKDWLLPRVLPGAGTGRKQWADLRFTPGELSENPFHALAAKLALMLPEESMTPRKVAERLEGSPDAFAQLARTVFEGKPHWAELLVFVDQFEELFSLVAPRYRDPFIAMLIAATQAPRMRIVATVRADFYHLCLDSPKFAEVLRAASFALAAPGPAALHEMVTGPAARAGLAFEEGLPARILDDTGTAPGSLALLAFALHELYQARALNGKLMHQAYEGFGKVQGAVSKRAEDTFTHLPAAVQNLLGSIFRELVEVDDRGVATRRRVTRAHLVSSTEAEALVDAFTDARLLVTDQSPEGAVVEVAHEAVLREWPRLKSWVAGIADDLRLWRQAERAAADWEKAQRAPTLRWVWERQKPALEALRKLSHVPPPLPDADVVEPGIATWRILEAQLSESPLRSFLHPEPLTLIEELESDDTPQQRREEIGLRLNQIGDPRRGVGLNERGLPDIAWIDVAPGEVTLETDSKGRFQTKPFRLARYPVTWAQYRAFLNADDGYCTPVWWEGRPREDSPGKLLWSFGNYPAINVSWYDALAYCRWLSAKQGLNIRLPTEWEWQWAAAGNTQQEYPWPGDWNTARANSEDAGIGRTVAVGLYPLGRSPFGMDDMAGNVFEWCLNAHGKPSSLSLERDVARVLRGGAWWYGTGSCRAADRYHYVPAVRSRNIGFRLCCSSPIE